MDFGRDRISCLRRHGIDLLVFGTYLILLSVTSDTCGFRICQCREGDRRVVL